MYKVRKRFRKASYKFLKKMCYEEYVNATGKVKPIKQGYIDKKVISVLSDYLVCDVLFSNVGECASEMITRKQFEEDFKKFYFYRLEHEVADESKCVYLLNNIIEDEEYFYGKYKWYEHEGNPKHSQNRYFRKKISEFLTHFNCGRNDIPKDEELPFLILASLIFADKESMEYKVEKAREMKKVLDTLKMDSIGKQKNNFALVHVLIWIIGCIDELQDMEDHGFVASWRGLVRFLDRFNFYEQLMKMNLLKIYCGLCKDMDRRLPISDAGRFDVELKIFMEQKGVSLIGKWGKETAKGIEMSSDTRPTQKLIRKIFGDKVEEVISYALFVSEVDLRKYKTDDEQTEQYFKQTYNEFISALLILLDTEKIDGMFIIEYVCLISGLIEYMRKNEKIPMNIVAASIEIVGENLLIRGTIREAVKLLFCDCVNEMFSDKYIDSEEMLLEVLFHECKKLNIEVQDIGVLIDKKKESEKVKEQKGKTKNKSE